MNKLWKLPALITNYKAKTLPMYKEKNKKKLKKQIIYNNN